MRDNKVSKRLRELAAGRIGGEIPVFEYDAAADEIDRLSQPAPASTGRENWSEVIDVIADELEEKANMTVISQFTALCEEFDRRAPVAARELDVEAEPELLYESIDTERFYALACSWRDGGDALWSDILDHIYEYAKREVAAARSAAQGTAPAPAKPWPQVNAEAIAAQDLLDWNRSQGKRPIEITKELGVARKAFEFLAAAKVITAAQQANQVAPVSTEQAGDAWLRTFMTDKQAFDWSWAQLKKDLNGERWTSGESVQSWAFYKYGWDYRAQYERQRAVPSPNNSPVGADRRE